MRYVIFRDDDTNALTPVECLDRLYRPLLDRGMPVNLAAIPDVATDAKMADGRAEGFLLDHLPDSERAGSGAPQPACARSGSTAATAQVSAATTQTVRPGQTIPMGQNSKLVSYLKDNPAYHILQHGCHHEYLEFDRPSYSEIASRLDKGARELSEAGFGRPATFVAPYDRVSRPGLRAVAERFRVFSTGWFELRRLPYTWWPKYAVKKIRHAPHWKVGGTILLSHPGCLLSCHHTYSTMLGAIIHYLETQQLTVLVTHWWEYFRDGQADEPFIDFLHQTASYVATHPHLKVVSFDDLAAGRVPLN